METRVAELERKLRRAEQALRVVAFFAVVLPVIAILEARSAARGRSTLAAPFRVVDGQHRTLLAVDTSPEGDQAHVRLFRPGGEHRAVLYTTSDGGGLDLFGRAGRPIAGLGVSPQGRGLGVFDASGKLVALLGASPSGGGLVILSPTGERVAVLGQGKDGGQLELFDAKGRSIGSAP